jgi:hypothetical protein
MVVSQPGHRWQAQIRSPVRMPVWSFDDVCMNAAATAAAAGAASPPQKLDAGNAATFLICTLRYVCLEVQGKELGQASVTRLRWQS